MYCGLVAAVLLVVTQSNKIENISQIFLRLIFIFNEKILSKVTDLITFKLRYPDLASPIKQSDRALGRVSGDGAGAGKADLVLNQINRQVRKLL